MANSDLAPVMPSDSTLMRRLVETIESQPSGATVYAVAEPEFPHDVHGLDTELGEKLARLAARHPTARVYGPFRCTRTDAGTPTEAQLGRLARAATDPNEVWVHFEPSSWRRLKAVSGVSGLRSLAGMIERGAQRERAVLSTALNIAPEEAEQIDTICFGQAAYRKFVIPYLVQVYGIEEALRRASDAAVE